MSRRAWLGAALAVALVVFGPSAAKRGLARHNAHRLAQLKGHEVYDPRADAAALYAEAEARARESNKRLLVILGGNWCEWCLSLDALMRDDLEVHDFMAAHFVVVKLDSARAEELDRRWGEPAEKFGVPVLVFLDPSGNVAHVQETTSLERWGGRLLGHDRDRVLAVLRANASR